MNVIEFTNEENERVCLSTDAICGIVEHADGSVSIDTYSGVTYDTDDYNFEELCEKLEDAD